MLTGRGAGRRQSLASASRRGCAYRPVQCTDAASATARKPLGVSLLQQGMKGLMGKDIKLLVSIRTLCMYMSVPQRSYTLPISLTSLGVRDFIPTYNTHA